MPKTTIKITADPRLHRVAKTPAELHKSITLDFTAPLLSGEEISQVVVEDVAGLVTRAEASGSAVELDITGGANGEQHIVQISAHGSLGSIRQATLSVLIADPAERAAPVIVAPGAIVWRGDWSALTSYVRSEVVRYGDGSWLALRPNIGVEPAEGADWAVLTGVATAEAARVAAEEAQAAAEIAQGVAEEKALETAADRVATGEDRVQTGLDAQATAADRIATGEDRVQTGLDAQATAADRIATGEDRVQTALDAQATAADRVATGQDRTQTGLDAQATAADRVQTGQDVQATGQNALDAQAAQEGAETAQGAAEDAQTAAELAAGQAQGVADSMVDQLQYFFRTAVKYELENHTH